ncbi:hypothetical protein P0G10_19190, partial [Eubacteriales bacterium DFI.9.88]|nr:hypothetical protein [Eubacteriales bacterium DFI.9.88]
SLYRDKFDLNRPLIQLVLCGCRRHFGAAGFCLGPVQAPYFQDASLLIAADCTAYAYGNFHQEFMKGKITLVGCPKLDDVDYTEKLTEIIRHNDIKSVTVVRMEVPCCGGIEAAVKSALQASGKFLPWQVVTISTCQSQSACHCDFTAAG